jgi:hypothetical protein
VSDKVLRWLFFEVFVSLLPLAASYTNLHLKMEPATLPSVLGNGELLVVCWVLCAGAIGELFGASPRYKRLKAFSGGSALLVLIFSSLIFAEIAERRFSKLPTNENLIVELSLLMFFSALYPV